MKLVLSQVVMNEVVCVVTDDWGGEGSSWQALAALRALAKWSRPADERLKELLGPGAHEDLSVIFQIST